MMHKRIIAILLALVLLLGLMPSALAKVGTGWDDDCRGNKKQDKQGNVTYGEHDWEKQSETPGSSCTSKGTATYHCSKCGANITRETKAPGHKWGKWKTTKEATCIKKGEETRTCKVCGKKETRKTSKADHEWGEWSVTKGATCTETGTREHTCRVCRETKKETIKKAPHTWGKWEIIVEATDHSPGTRAHTCEICGAQETEDYDPEGTLRRGMRGDAVKHLQEGLICYGALNGHADGDFGKGTEKAVKAVQEAEGLAVDGVAWPQTQARLGHRFGEWEAISELSDFSMGLRQRTCSRCGYVEKEEAWPEPIYRRGDKGDGVKALQEGLNAAGYSCGKVDGDFGKKTEAAVKAIEEAHGVAADGIAWPGVQKWLGLIEPEPAPESELQLVIKPELSATALSFGDGDRIVVPMTLRVVSGTPLKLEKLDFAGGQSESISQETWMNGLLTPDTEYSFTYTIVTDAYDLEDDWCVRTVDAVAYDPETMESAYGHAHVFFVQKADGPSVKLIQEDTTGMGGDVGDVVSVPMLVVNNGTEDLLYQDTVSSYDTDYEVFPESERASFPAGDFFWIDFNVEVLGFDAELDGDTFFRVVTASATTLDGSQTVSDDETLHLWFSGLKPALTLEVNQITPDRDVWIPDDESGHIADIEYSGKVINSGMRPLSFTEISGFLAAGGGESLDSMLAFDAAVTLEPGESYAFDGLTVSIDTGEIIPGSGSEIADGRIEAAFAVEGLEPETKQHMCYSDPARFNYNVLLGAGDPGAEKTTFGIDPSKLLRNAAGKGVDMPVLVVQPETYFQTWEYDVGEKLSFSVHIYDGGIEDAMSDGRIECYVNGELHKTCNTGPIAAHDVSQAVHIDYEITKADMDGGVLSFTFVGYDIPEDGPDEIPMQKVRITYDLFGEEASCLALWADPIPAKPYKAGDRVEVNCWLALIEPLGDAAAQLTILESSNPSGTETISDEPWMDFTKPTLIAGEDYSFTYEIEIDDDEVSSGYGHRYLWASATDPTTGAEEFAYLEIPFAVQREGASIEAVPEDTTGSKAKHGAIMPVKITVFNNGTTELDSFTIDSESCDGSLTPGHDSWETNLEDGGALAPGESFVLNYCVAVGTDDVDYARLNGGCFDRRVWVRARDTVSGAEVSDLVEFGGTLVDTAASLNLFVSQMTAGTTFSEGDTVQFKLALANMSDQDMTQLSIQAYDGQGGPREEYSANNLPSGYSLDDYDQYTFTPEDAALGTVTLKWEAAAVFAGEDVVAEPYVREYTVAEAAPTISMTLKAEITGADAQKTGNFHDGDELELSIVAGNIGDSDLENVRLAYEYFWLSNPYTKQQFIDAFEDGGVIHAGKELSNPSLFIPLYATEKGVNCQVKLTLFAESHGRPVQSNPVTLPLRIDTVREEEDLSLDAVIVDKKDSYGLGDLLVIDFTAVNHRGGNLVSPKIELTEKYQDKASRWTPQIESDTTYLEYNKPYTVRYTHRISKEDLEEGAVEAAFQASAWVMGKPVQITSSPVGVYRMVNGHDFAMQVVNDRLGNSIFRSLSVVEQPKDENAYYDNAIIEVKMALTIDSFDEYTLVGISHAPGDYVEQSWVGETLKAGHSYSFYYKMWLNPNTTGWKPRTVTVTLISRTTGRTEYESCQVRPLFTPATVALETPGGSSGGGKPKLTLTVDKTGYAGKAYHNDYMVIPISVGSEGKSEIRDIKLVCEQRMLGAVYNTQIDPVIHVLKGGESFDTVCDVRAIRFEPYTSTQCSLTLHLTGVYTNDKGKDETVESVLVTLPFQVLLKDKRYATLTLSGNTEPFKVYYLPNDDVMVTLRVRNPGTVAMKNVRVELDGATLERAESLNSVSTVSDGKLIGPEMEGSATLQYSIQPEDVQNGYFKLEFVAVGEAEDTGETLKSSRCTVKKWIYTKPIEQSLKLSASVLYPKPAYAPGETVPCKVTITNNSSQKVHTLGVYAVGDNRMENLNWHDMGSGIKGWECYFMEYIWLAPGESRAFETTVKIPDYFSENETFFAKWMAEASMYDGFPARSNVGTLVLPVSSDAEEFKPAGDLKINVEKVTKPTTPEDEWCDGDEVFLKVCVDFTGNTTPELIEVNVSNDRNPNVSTQVAARANKSNFIAGHVVTLDAADADENDICSYTFSAKATMKGSDVPPIPSNDFPVSFKLAPGGAGPDDGVEPGEGSPGSPGTQINWAAVKKAAEADDAEVFEGTDGVASDSADETKPDAAGETKPDGTDETKPDAADETKPDTADETKPDTADETKPDAADETKPDAVDETKPDGTVEVKPAGTDEIKPDATGSPAEGCEETVVTIAGADYDIPATVCVPNGEGPFPAVVMLHGTGSTRDEAGDGYRVAAPVLAEKYGIATIRIDFPGNGDSTADYMQYNFKSAVADAMAAADYMADLDNINGDAIGVMGWSQGGTDALLACAWEPETFKSIVTWAGSPDMMLDGFFSEDDYDEARANGYFVMEFDWRDSLNVSLDWCDDVANTDVLAEFKKGYAGPVLAIAGTNDDTVNPVWSERIVEASGNAASRTYFIEEMDHTFNVFAEEDLHSLYDAVDATGAFFAETLG